MILTIKERFLLLSALPREGDISTIRILRQLRESLSFSEGDHAAFGIKQVGDQIHWDSTVPQDTDVDIGPKAHVLVQEALKAMNKAKKLTEDFLPLWDKFSPEG
jgi:hypothetical protein